MGGMVINPGASDLSSQAAANRQIAGLEEGPFLDHLPANKLQAGEFQGHYKTFVVGSGLQLVPLAYAMHAFAVVNAALRSAFPTGQAHAPRRGIQPKPPQLLQFWRPRVRAGQPCPQGGLHGCAQRHTANALSPSAAEEGLSRTLPRRFARPDRTVPTSRRFPHSSFFQPLRLMRRCAPSAPQGGGSSSGGLRGSCLNDRPRWCKDPTIESTNCRVDHGGLHCNQWTTVVQKGAK